MSLILALGILAALDVSAPLRDTKIDWNVVAQGVWAFERGDYTKALEYALPAAEQGASPSRFVLGEMYARGLGVEKDVVKAAQLYRSAANASRGDAQARLGGMYLEGTGVSRDLVQAYLWTSLAIAHRVPGLERVRKKIAKGLTSAQLEEALRLEAAWKDDAWRRFEGRTLMAEVAGVSEPKAINRSKIIPEYPEAARSSGVEGSASVVLKVSRDGRVLEAHVWAEPPGMGFEQAALDAVLRWEFEPAIYLGRPVEVDTAVRVQFKP